jgi:hypothetical protein
MRKVLWIFSLNLLAIAANASVVTLDCTPFPLTTSDTLGGTVTCPAFTIPDAFTLNSVLLTETAEYEGSSFSVLVLGVTLGPSGVDWSSTPQFLLFTPGKVETASQSAVSGVTIPNFSTPFGIFFLPTNTDSGSVTSTTESATVTYTYTPIPEPAAMSLVAIGLLALGFAVSRWMPKSH